MQAKKKQIAKKTKEVGENVALIETLTQIGRNAQGKRATLQLIECEV